MVYKITYNEETEFGQDTLNIMGIVGLFTDLENARKIDALMIAQELERASKKLVSAIIAGKADYFNGGIE